MKLINNHTDLKVGDKIVLTEQGLRTYDDFFIEYEEPVVYGIVVPQAIFDTVVLIRFVNYKGIKILEIYIVFNVLGTPTMRFYE